MEGGREGIVVHKVLGTKERKARMRSVEGGRKERREGDRERMEEGMRKETEAWRGWRKDREGGREMDECSEGGKGIKEGREVKRRCRKAGRN